MRAWTINEDTILLKFVSTMVHLNDMATRLSRPPEAVLLRLDFLGGISLEQGIDGEIIRRNTIKQTNLFGDPEFCRSAAAQEKMNRTTYSPI